MRLVNTLLVKFIFSGGGGIVILLFVWGSLEVCAMGQFFSLGNTLFHYICWGTDKLHLLKLTEIFE